MDNKLKDWFHFRTLSLPFIMKWTWIIASFISIIAGFVVLFTSFVDVVKNPTEDEKILSILEEVYEDKAELDVAFNNIKESIANGETTAQEFIDKYGDTDEKINIKLFLLQIFGYFIGFPLALRLLTEISIVIFTINENLQAIRNKQDNETHHD